MAPDARLLLDGTMVLLIAAIYGIVGRMMMKRDVPPGDARLAARLFGVWWFALAAATGLGGLQTLLVGFGVEALPAHLPFYFAGLLLLPVALWALLYYLLYIYTGKRGVLVPLAVAYGAVGVYFLYLAVRLKPVGVQSTGWSTVMRFEETASPLETALVLLLLLAPVLLAAIAYGSLYFQVRDRTRRFRIGLVSLAFLGWFGSAAVASLLGLSQAVWWPPVSRGIGLAATLLVLLAYRPPGWIQRRLRVHVLDAPEGSEEAAGRREAREHTGRTMPPAARGEARPQVAGFGGSASRSSRILSR